MRCSAISKRSGSTPASRRGGAAGKSLTAPSNAPCDGHVPAAPAPGVGEETSVAGRFGVGSLLMIGLGIFAVLILLRALGGLFGRSGRRLLVAHGHGRNASSRDGPRPRLWTARLRRLQRAPRRWLLLRDARRPRRRLAGNWLYDQFSGRHGSPGQTDAGSYIPTESTSAYDPAGDAPVGADDDGGMGASWDDPALPIPAAIGAAVTAEPTGAVAAAIGAVVAATAAETGSLWLAGRLRRVSVGPGILHCPPGRNRCRRDRNPASGPVVLGASARHG